MVQEEVMIEVMHVQEDVVVEEVTLTQEHVNQVYNQVLHLVDLETMVVTAHLHLPTGVVAVAVELANKEKMEVHHVEDMVVMENYMILVEQTDTMRVVVQEQTATTQITTYNLVV